MKSIVQIPIDVLKDRIMHYRYYYGLSSVDISGGEPTIYPNINQIVSFCAGIGLRPTIITNAQLSGKIEELIDCGLDDIILSIHNTGKKHDEAMGCPGAYIKLLKAVNMLEKRRFSFRTNTVVTEWNYRSLPNIARFLSKIEPAMVNLIVFNPCGGSLWSTHGHIPFQAQYSAIAPYMKEAIDILDDKGIWVNVRYMPLCTMNGYERHVCNFLQMQYDPYEWDYRALLLLDKKKQKRIAQKAKIEQIFGRNDNEMVANYIARKWMNTELLKIGEDPLKHWKYANRFGPQCKECMNYRICDGIYYQYYGSFGLEEFSPVIQNGVRYEDPLHYRLSDIRWMNKVVS